MSNFQRGDEERNADLHLQLSEKYMAYKDYADRCMITQDGLAKEDHRVFYLKPNSQFLKEPRVQNQFRNDFIRQIGQAPQPEPLTYLADDLHKAYIELTQNRSNPHCVKEELCNFFKKRQYKLQHKRYKMLVRWAHHCLTSDKIDRSNMKFNPAISKLQFELEQAVKRYQRLEGTDHFLTPDKPSQKDESSYQDSGDRPVLSALRSDDLDVYMRIVTYEERVTRKTEKFIQRIKWTPLAHRFEIYNDHVDHFQGIRNSSIESQNQECEQIQAKGDQLIDVKKLGDVGEQELAQIRNSKLVVKTERRLEGNVREKYMNTAKYNYDMPPMVFWNEVELKLRLEALASQHKIAGNMEADNGHSFSYQVFVYFPQKFQQQIVMNQFPPYDAIPSQIDPKNLGKDIKKVIKRNQKKYGRTQGQNTLLERMEIKKHSEEMGFEFMNSVENALFGAFNNGQLNTEHFPTVRYKDSDWVEQICFEPTLDNELMHQSGVLSGEKNIIDECLVHFLEIMNVNDHPNVTLIIESISQIHYDKVRFGKVKTDFLNFDPNEVDTFFTEDQKQFLSLFKASFKSKADFDSKQQYQDIKPTSLHEIPNHLLCAQYMLQTLNAREQKTKLLYTLNAFRAIQRRITLELREMGTRDRILGDRDESNPLKPMEEMGESKIGDEDDSHESGMLPAAEDTAAGKERINLGKDPLVDINKYQLRGNTCVNHNFLYSTCPTIPRYHQTYGQAADRQEISKEIQFGQRIMDPRRTETKKFLGRIDEIYKHAHTEINLVKDDYGVHILYDSAFTDMRSMEQEVLKICSFYINKAEPILDNDLRNMYPIIDRIKILDECLEYENKYQDAKLELITAYMECYEHISDLLEQHRMIQTMVDEMARRPRLNLSGSYFKDSYEAEIEYVKAKTRLVRRVIRRLMTDEYETNKDVREYLERCYRKLHDQMKKKFKYVEVEEQDNELNRREAVQTGVGGTRESKNDLMLDGREGKKEINEEELQVRRDAAMMEAHKVLQSHNLQDPREVAKALMIPYKNLETILKDHHERDQLVGVTIHEHVSFSKMNEGYPQFMYRNAKPQNAVQFSQHGDQVDILDFYDSLQMMPKVVAAIQHASQELHEVHRPDNGLMSTLLDIQMLKYLDEELLTVESIDGLTMDTNEGQQYIEDNTIASNSDHLMWLSKELAACKDDTNRAQNPFVMGKLDLQSVEDFDFRKYQGYIDTDDNAGHGGMAQKGNQDPNKEQVNKKNFGQFFKKINNRFANLNVPSMLILLCNSVEMIRLRNVLIQTMEQEMVLGKVYTAQMARLSKEGRPNFKDPFNFQNYVANAGEHFINFIDDGPGDEINIKLAINEFDPKLRSCLNFTDPECVKAMMIPMGLEEFRAVVQYEVMNLQALIVGTRINQLMMDNSMRKQCEIEFFAQGFTVANPVFNLYDKLQGQNIFPNNLMKLPDNERSAMKAKIESEVGMNFYNIIKRKQSGKEHCERIFKTIKNASIQMKDQKIEVTQKQLRGCKLVLCHDYSQDVLARVYCDAIKLQLLHETNELRKRAYLLPREYMFLEFFQAKSGEHQFAATNEDWRENLQREHTLFFNKQDNRIKSFWRIPSFKEIMELDVNIESFKQANMPDCFNYDLGVPAEKSLPEFMRYDPMLKCAMKVQSLTYNFSRDTESVMKERGRLVEFDEGYDYNACGKLPLFLSYFKSISNIFDIEFFTNKLGSSANTIANLEKMVLSGVRFWDEGDDTLLAGMESSSESEDEEQIKQIPAGKGPQKPKLKQDDNRFEKTGHKPLKNVLATKVADKIASEKNDKLQLQQDLESIKEVFTDIENTMKKQEMAGSIQRASQLLQEIHQLKFYGVLNIFYQMRDKYLKDRTGQKEILFINNLIQEMSHTNDIKVTFDNGFHVNKSITAIQKIALDKNAFDVDYDSFFKATQPLIDEEALNPHEFNLIQGIYLTDSINLVTFKKHVPYMGRLFQRDYHCLDYSMTNLSRKIRRYAMQLINSMDLTLRQFILSKNKLNEADFKGNPTIFNQILQDKKGYMKTLIRARQFRNILQIIRQQKMIPLDIEEYARITAHYQEEVSRKIENHKDYIAKSRANAEGRSKSNTQKGTQSQGKDQQALNDYDTAVSEIEVVQNEIQKYMIKVSFRMFENETQSLAKVFELTNLKVQAFIHPVQQFASTFQQAEDGRNHLDIINKVGPIQKMLTQIKNRCLEIQTLTSGVGIVISSKDLNETLEECCRSLIKFGEIEMRNRCHHLITQNIQYENLIYFKDRQLLNLENKLRIAKQEMNKIINTKVFSRGNNLVYELDTVNRQLRLMKDNIFLLEKNLTDKIRLCYDRELEETRMHLADYKQKYQDYGNNVASKIHKFVREENNAIDKTSREMAKMFEDLDIDLEKGPNGRYRPKPKVKDQDGVPKAGAAGGTTTMNIDKISINVQQTVINKGGESTQMPADYNKLVAENESLKMNEREAREEVERLQDIIRKYRVMMKFKEVLTKERHDFKIDNLRQQLTSNTTLWEQLAESEKREKILKQEIERAQQEIATQEKIIERLKDDIKKEGREKQKLLQYKTTKSKRLDELEGKAREFEVLSSVNLGKILSMLESKERKINDLQKNEDNMNEYIGAVMKINNQEMKQVKKSAHEETKFKMEAMTKLESLRQELQMIQGNDQVSVNFWKEQCQSLFEICKNLKEDNENLVDNLGNLSEALSNQAGGVHPLDQFSNNQDLLNFLNSQTPQIRQQHHPMNPHEFNTAAPGHRRGTSQQYASAINTQRARENYEKDVFGMENSLKNHMLGLNRGTGRKKIGLGAISGPPGVGASSNFSLPKIGGRNQMQYGDGGSPFIGGRQGIGIHGPNNVFNTLNHSINPSHHHNSTSINKTIDHENSFIEQTTMMTVNPSLHQPSISQGHGVSYQEGDNTSNDLAGVSKFQAAPLTQRQQQPHYDEMKGKDPREGKTSDKNFSGMQNPGSNQPGVQQVWLKNPLQPKQIHPPSKLDRTLDVQGARAGSIRTKKQL